MSDVLTSRWLRAALAAAACTGLAACGSFDSASHRVANAITPYKIEIVQGNFVSREQVAQLQQGMSRQQVREVLGTPLLSSLFHADRWDYVFTLKRGGKEVQSRKLSVFFKDDQLERFAGDEMPSEAEFVASLDVKKRGSGKVPPLEATEEQLKRYSAPARPDQPATSSVQPQAAPISYPPLESTASGR
ncbi:outer membrane protein assembly factor BamE [Xylophilus sp.]|uniref:outer membrane protein assembly factor BamE n=1 Tax=Xylophilus sp. TaxID=2653893 RepID=UPI0013BD28E2|nr:outer membrane protein assembly factor BamE [Xylophilus sp.]KAF1044863.1 MAG: Outer membrane protein assembly factor BamE [Xylophilus sp.]